MNSDARLRKDCAMAWSSILGIFVCRFWAAFVFGLTTRRARYLVRFRAREGMTGRSAGLPDAVEHRTRLLTFSLSWRTPSSHNLSLHSVVWITAMLAPAEIQCQ
jgi:hypothetical protein